MLLTRDHELSSQEGLFVKKSNDTEMIFLSYAIGRDQYDQLLVHRDLTLLAQHVRNTP